MLTFSQLVDDIVSELRRSDLSTSIQDYLNQTIRELHSEPTKGNAVLFERNLIEDTLTADVDTGYEWQIPDGTRFQRLQTVRYSSLVDVNGGYVYPKKVRPGPITNDENYYFYQSGEYTQFWNYGGTNAVIDIAWYEYLPYLKYYASGARPATYDVVDGWTYYDLTGSGSLDFTLAANQATAVALVSNWMIQNYYHTIREGLRAKVYKRVGDTERAKLAFSLYSSMRKAMYTNERAVLGDQI